MSNNKSNVSEIQMSSFAKNIMNDKYAHEKKDGTKETWEQISHRVATNVLGAVDADEELIKKVEKAISERKFMPGGRYLYASGRSLAQTQNCLLLRCDDSREGWAELLHKATMALMTGAGIGVVYSDVREEGAIIRRTGGKSTGPIALMKMLNEVGRGIMQGGSRRSAIWAGLHWNHPDIMKFIHLKDWSQEVRDLKEKDYNFPATLDGTNISVILDDDFFEAFFDKKNPQHVFASTVYRETVSQMLKKAEPGFSVDIGDNRGENLRNAPVSGETNVLTDTGYRKVKDIVNSQVVVWTGKQWANTEFKKTKTNTETIRISMSDGKHIACDPEHEFFVENVSESGVQKISKVRADKLCEGDVLHVSLPESVVSVKETIKVSKITKDINQDVFCCDVGVEEHSFVAEGVVISNCCEITSRDDSDICNLGSINLSRVESLEEMKELVEIGTAFLLAGTVYSTVPYAQVDKTRSKNRRLGLGVMGVHEWLLKHGKKYGPDSELEEYMKIYSDSGKVANKYAKMWKLSKPVKTRAIAPTGTIGIVAESTTGIEPIFCVAYKRRYLKGDVVHYQYVVDPCAKRLIDSGVDPELIEDAYSLAENVERRVEMQAWMQQFVDHAISSTINLPSWGSSLNNSDNLQSFGDMLMKYLPKLRGITCYPDGARGGQPLTPVKYSTAVKHLDEVFVEQADVCDITKGGSCGV